MNINDMTEQAYRNGYEAGLEAGKPKWIPVTERLPDVYRVAKSNPSASLVSNPVVTYSQNATPKLCVAVYVRDGVLEAGVFYADGLTEIHPNSWMPLPEPPKEETP